MRGTGFGSDPFTARLYPTGPIRPKRTKAPISVLNTGDHKQLARASASALTENIIDLTSINDDHYVSMTISQNGLFNKSGSAEVHIRDAATGESKRVAKWGVNPEAIAALPA